MKSAKPIAVSKCCTYCVELAMNYIISSLVINFHPRNTMANMWSSQPRALARCRSCFEASYWWA